jgi:hypothetical protein
LTLFITFARDHVASHQLMFLFCKSEDNVLGCLTKARQGPLLQFGLMGLGILRVGLSYCKPSVPTALVSQVRARCTPKSLEVFVELLHGRVMT